MGYPPGTDAGRGRRVTATAKPLGSVPIVDGQGRSFGRCDNGTAHLVMQNLYITNIPDSVYHAYSNLF